MPNNTTNPKTFEFNIGADPEYLCFYGKRTAPAKTTLQTFHGKNLPEATQGFTVGDAGILGWDGHATTGELRPNPSKSPKKVTENIGKLYQTLHEKAPFIDTTVLSIGEEVGGHIHLEIPPHLVTAMKTPQANAKLQRQIATFLIPILASEHRLSAISRFGTTNNYGKANDIRIENRGTDTNEVYTCEVRGPSSEWTVTPEICNATLSYLGVIWHEIISGNLKNNPSVLFRNNTQTKAVQQMLMADYRFLTEAIVKELKKTIKTFELYPKYKKEVDLILDPQKTHKKKEAVGWNVNKGWGFVNTNKVSKKDVMSVRKINKKLKSINYENIRNEFALTYNNDYNVETFVDAISERIATTGWALDNEYVFFGLRKEFGDYSIANVGKNEYYAMSTTAPKTEINDSLERMRSRYMTHRGNDIKIDPKTGKTIGGKRECIIVGIPYEKRATKDVMSLISIIWDIEKKRITPKKFEELPNVTAKNNKNADTEEETTEFQNSLEEAQPISLIETARRIFGGEESNQLEYINNDNQNQD